MTGSVSEQVRALKNFLLGGAEEGTEAAAYFDKVAMGEIPLVITVNKVHFLERSMRLSLLLTTCFHRPQYISQADHIAAVINVKRAIEKETGTALRIVLEGAHESHLVCPIF